MPDAVPGSRAADGEEPSSCDIQPPAVHADRFLLAVPVGTNSVGMDATVELILLATRRLAPGSNSMTPRESLAAVAAAILYYSLPMPAWIKRSTSAIVCRGHCLQHFELKQKT